MNIDSTTEFISSVKLFDDLSTDSLIDDLIPCFFAFFAKVLNLPEC